MTKKTRILLFFIGVLFFFGNKEKANAQTASDLLLKESGGAAIVLNMDAYNDAATDDLGYKIIVKEEVESSDLFMANVKQNLNVRAEPSLDAEIVGLLYKDCGGTVIERGDEWSYIKSGDLVGYAKSDWLYFDDDAKNLAKEVGNMTVSITVNATKVYSEPDTGSSPLGYAVKNALFDLIYEQDDDWVCIAYDDYDGFVKTDLVEVNFDIDHGETMEVINERKAKEEEEKQKLIRQNEAIAADADDVKLLASIIYCEARGESYEGKLAVGSVIMNRVRSGSYPDTIYGVVFASGQFTPAKTGALQKVYEAGTASADCISAAEQVLGGYTNVGDLTHFRRKGSKEGVIIGNHVFY